MESLNYDISELVLSYINDVTKLIKLLKVSKLWLEIIKTSKSVWSNIIVDLSYYKHVRDEHLIENNKAKYPIQKLKCNNFITDNCVKYLPLSMLHCGHLITDNGIKHLLLKELKCNSSITNDGIKNLPRQTSSVGLEILICPRNSKISDEGIKNLSQLIELWCNPLITNEGIKNLSQLKKLYLSGYGGHITGEGIKNLLQLEILHCDESDDLTDECIKNLSQLKELSCGRLTTDNGIKHLKLEILYCNSIITGESIIDMPLIELHCGDKITDENIRKMIKKQSENGKIQLKKLRFFEFIEGYYGVSTNIFKNYDFIDKKYINDVKNIYVEWLSNNNWSQ
jgi:hypothetical protein